MSKKHKHPEHVNNERWLVSYADFITLLFAFFVVLFSSSQVDRSKTKKMALAIESAFSKFSMFSQTGGELNVLATSGKGGQSNKNLVGEEGSSIYMAPNLLDSSDESFENPKGDPSLDTKVGIPVTEAEALAQVKQEVQDLLLKKKFPGKVSMVTQSRGLVISIREDGIFESGSNVLTPEAKELLWGIGEIVSQIPNAIRVEGHTDSSAAKGMSNWDLSVLRATYVVEWLVNHFNVDPARFSATGYGEYKPLASNATPTGRKKNRRVELVVLNEKIEATLKKDAPLAEEETENKEETSQNSEESLSSSPPDTAPAQDPGKKPAEVDLPENIKFELPKVEVKALQIIPPEKKEKSTEKE